MVVIRQQSVKIEGGQTYLSDHGNPVNVIPVDTYDRLSENNNQGFNELGIKVTLLHDPEAEPVVKPEEKQTTPTKK